MEKHVFIGTDVSKLTLDHAIKTSEAHVKTPNNLKGFKQWLKWALGFGRKEELWVVMDEKRGVAGAKSTRCTDHRIERSHHPSR